MKTKTVLISLAYLILLYPVVYAQDKPQTTDATRREKAVELLQSLATQLPTLQSAENRARIGANIADSLWAHDEKRARALFVGIEDDINWGLRVRENKTGRDDYASTVFMQLRTDTVTRIAKHDAELALNFLRATGPTYEKIPRIVVERERDFEVKLAAEIAGTNPDFAFKIGRQSLAGGFSDHLLLLLRRLHMKHKEHGVTLYKETVRALKEADFSHQRPALTFAVALAEVLTPPIADEAAFRDFIDLWSSTAIANRCDKPDVADESAEFCEQAVFLIRQMKKFAPLQSGQLRQADEDDREESNDLIYNELQDVLATGDLDDALALAKKYPQMERTIYWETALKAQADGNSERAQKVANDLTRYPEVREELLERLKAYEEAASITDEQLAKIPTALNEMKEVEEQIGFLVSLANNVGAKNRPAALKLLDQAAGLVESLKPGKDRVNMQLSLAVLYCTEKGDRGLTLMESLIPKLNELIDAAAKLDQFDTHYLRDGEWNMSADGPLGQILTYLSQNAAYFAWTDFDRAVSLAAQFERTEVRMMAQTKLAQSILAGRPKRFHIPRGLR